MKRKKAMAVILSSTMVFSTVSAGSFLAAENDSESAAVEETAGAEEASTEDSAAGDTSSADLAATTEEEKETIESTLNLANNGDVTWSYDSSSDSWTMSIVSTVVNPEIPNEQGVSVNVPGAYVKGIDTDGDGTEDVTADTYSEAVNGTLVIDYDAEVTSENGQVYTASTAPCVLTTGAAGYSEQENQLASSTYASDGYISISCGNRGKQSTAEDEDGNTYYTGDAPLCLVDQKNAIRFVKYNILLGNLPGSVDYFVSTGGSGGGAHATMVAATGNSEDYYDYEIEAGAVGVYRNEDGTYSTAVTIDGTDYEISDGVWGCVAYSAITSLAEADMDMAFEYTLDTDYSFNTDFQKQLASYLSEEYMDYINSQNLSVEESAVGFDLNEDGDTEDTVDLTIEYDEEKYADTNGYGGTYLTLYLDEFISNLQWYIDNLDYAEGWTWFDEDGSALSDEEVAAMTTEDKAEAFIEGRYAASTGSEGMGGPGNMGGGMMQGTAPSDMGTAPSDTGTAPSDMGTAPSDTGTAPSDMGSAPSDTGSAPEGMSEGEAPSDSTADSNGEAAGESEVSTDNESSSSETPLVGTPDAGTTQSAASGTDSANYSTYEEMLEAYEEDIASIEAGDKYGNNIVELYNPLSYIGDDDVDSPTWTRIVMGASEGDMSLFASLNLQIAWLNAGTDATIEWQWNGGHVPSEIFGESLSLTIDEMYGEYVDGAVEITKPEAEAQTENGDATEATGTDISSWVSYEEGEVSFSLADAASYRTDGAAKATPGFDVMDYGQETYEFGNSEQDARHFDRYVLQALQDHADTLSGLFNAGSTDTEEDTEVSTE